MGLTQPEILEALERCQQVLAMLTEPSKIGQTSVPQVYFAAIEAEAFARSVIEKARAA